MSFTSTSEAIFDLRHCEADVSLVFLIFLRLSTHSFLPKKMAVFYQNLTFYLIFCVCLRRFLLSFSPLFLNPHLLVA